MLLLIRGMGVPHGSYCYFYIVSVLTSLSPQHMYLTLPFLLIKPLCILYHYPVILVKLFTVDRFCQTEYMPASRAAGQHPHVKQTVGCQIVPSCYNYIVVNLYIIIHPGVATAMHLYHKFANIWVAISRSCTCQLL